MKGKTGKTTASAEESLLEIKKYAKIIASNVAIQQVEKLASSDERKAIWALCSGKLTREELAKKSGVHLNTVKSFVEIAMTCGILEEEKGKGGHPKRVVDHIPSEWKEKVKKEAIPSEEQKPEALSTTS